MSVVAEKRIREALDTKKGVALANACEEFAAVLVLEENPIAAGLFAMAGALARIQESVDDFLI